MERIYLYDTTLRDGAQTQGVDFTVVDKQDIALQLDRLGIDYIEGGWPGANPTDDAFFADQPKLSHAHSVAFGMTRRPNTSADNDPGLNSLVNSGVNHICIVGKSWDFQVTEALDIKLEDNLAMIKDSVTYLAGKKIEVLFDAEHFFDGYLANPDYAMQAVQTAYDAGARWIVLCDTNGGTLPHDIAEIVAEVTKTIPGDHLGIHCHNDTENAVANSLAAVRAGARMVQGTIGGCGERCGNANLISLIPTLKLKMGYDVGIDDDARTDLTHLSRAFDDRLNRPRRRHAPYVGESAFAHKGGLHVSAVLKNPAAYEHIDPELGGNERQILVSDQAGRSNIINRLQKIGLDVDLDDKDTQKNVAQLVDEIKERENQGYAYDSADASFEILARRFLDNVPEFYDVRSFRAIDERRWNAKGELITISEAKVKLVLDDKECVEVAEGNGPVNALNKALRKALVKKYPQLADIHLVDFKVRIVTPERATEAITRVQIETQGEDGRRWTTVGVSGNIIDASYNALDDAFVYKLLNN